MNTAFPVTIYHNPNCGTSRNTLALIRSAGYEPAVVEYLKTGWEPVGLRNLMTALGMTPRELLRVKGTQAEEMGLTRPDTDDEEIFKAMLEYPVLVNRPVVVTPKGARLCRPPELALPLLEETKRAVAT